MDNRTPNDNQSPFLVVFCSRIQAASNFGEIAFAMNQANHSRPSGSERRHLLKICRAKKNELAEAGRFEGLASVSAVILERNKLAALPAAPRSSKAVFTIPRLFRRRSPAASKS